MKSNGTAVVMDEPKTRSWTAVPQTLATPLGAYEELELSKIWIDGGNHRLKELEDSAQVKTLCDTLAREGQQQPIRVTQAPKEGRPFRLVFGERRFTAAGVLKWKTIKAFVSAPMSELEIESVRAIENLARRDLELAEICRLVGRMFDAIRADARTRGENLSEEQVCQAMATRLGQAVSWVRDHLRIKRLESSKKAWEFVTVGKKMKDGSLVKLPKQHAREIAKLADPTIRDEVAEWCLHKQWVSDECPKSIEMLRNRCGNLMHQLKTVPWKLDVPYAGGPACTGCPSNSANDKSLFEHDAIHTQRDAAAGLCLNQACFNKKRDQAQKELTAAAAETSKQLKALKPAERKDEVKELVKDVPAGIRADTYKQVVESKAAELPAPAAKATGKKKGKAAPARLDKKDLGPTPKEIAQDKVDDAMEDWNGKVTQLVRNAVHDKPGRLAATAVLLDNPIFNKNGPANEKKRKTPSGRRMLELTAAPTLAGISVLEKSAEDCETATLYHLYETVHVDVVISLAEAWKLKLPPKPKLEDFLKTSEESKAIPIAKRQGGKGLTGKAHWSKKGAKKGKKK